MGVQVSNTIDHPLANISSNICKYKPTEFDFNRFVINEKFNPFNPTHVNAYSNTVRYLILKHEFAEAAKLINENEANIQFMIDDVMYDLQLKAIFLKFYCI